MVRRKHRYFLVEILPKEFLNPKNFKIGVKERDIVQAVLDAVKEMHGDFGVGSIQPSLHVKHYNEFTRVFLLRCQRGPHYLISSVIPLIKSIRKSDVILRTLTVAGTIRSCLKFLIDHDRRELIKLTSRKKHLGIKEDMEAKMKEIQESMSQEINQDY